MPKIPVYQQQVSTATGSLSPRADAGAFTAPGQALAQFGDTVTQIADNFVKEERKRNDISALSEESLNLSKKLDDVLINSKASSTEDASTEMQSAIDDFVSKLPTKYSKNRTQFITNRITPLIREKLYNAKVAGFARGNEQAKNNANLLITQNLQSMNGLSPDSALYKIKQDETLLIIKEAIKGGIPIDYNEATVFNKFESDKKDNILKNIFNSIQNVTSQEQADEILDNASKNPSISATALGQIQAKITNQKDKIKNNNISFLVTASEIDNFGETDADSLETLEAKLNEQKQGNFDTDEKQAIWNSLSDSDKKLVISGLDQKFNQAKQNFTLNKQIQNAAREKQDEELYSDAVSKIPDLTISEINQIPFSNTAQGNNFKQNLIKQKQNLFAEGNVNKDGMLEKNTEINQKVTLGVIKSVTQPFLLKNETEPKSLVQRNTDGMVGNESFNIFSTMIKDRGGENFRKDEKVFDDFFEEIRSTLIGDPLLERNPSVQTITRVESIRNVLIKRFYEGKKKGFSANQLTNPDPSNKNYIFPDFELSIPDKRTIMKEKNSAFTGRLDITSLSDEDNAIIGKFQLNFGDLTLDELNRVVEIREANRPPTQKQVADFLNISVSELTKPMIIQSGIYQDWKNTKGRIFSRTLRREGN